MKRDGGRAVFVVQIWPRFLDPLLSLLLSCCIPHHHKRLFFRGVLPYPYPYPLPKPAPPTMTLNLDKCIEQLTRCELLSENTIKDLCQHMREMLIYESNVQQVKAPVTVVGDVHGYAPLCFFSLDKHHNNPNIYSLTTHINTLIYISIIICIRSSHIHVTIAQIHKKYAAIIMRKTCEYDILMVH